MSEASPAWQDYVDYMDAVVLDGLKQTCLTSLKSMLNQIVRCNMAQVIYCSNYICTVGVAYMPRNLRTPAYGWFLFYYNRAAWFRFWPSDWNWLRMKLPSDLLWTRAPPMPAFKRLCITGWTASWLVEDSLRCWVERSGEVKGQDLG